MSLAENIKKRKEAAELKLYLASLKKGKNPEQCKAIDYLCTPDEDEAAKKGCFKKKKKKKKKGCFSKSDAIWDMTDYCNHVQVTVNALNLKQRAIEKIGLDESQISEIPPVVLSSFVFKNANVKKLFCKSEESNIKGEYRNVSNQYSVTWIFFSATQIYTYTYTFDTMSDDSWEYTRDFFYSDITCIRTEHEVEERIYSRSKGCGLFFWKKNVEYFHNNRHWDTLQITVPNDFYSFTCKTTDTIEQSIQAAKAMIREKKYS